MEFEDVVRKTLLPLNDVLLRMMIDYTKANDISKKNNVMDQWIRDPQFFLESKLLQSENDMRRIAENSTPEVYEEIKRQIARWNKVIAAVEQNRRRKKDENVPGMTEEVANEIDAIFNRAAGVAKVKN